ncbi:MAG TPA: 6-bladed beta-propeller [Gemmatimonadaceae bacterium]|nr:6-bladed beta-propeller [Gemmatimonadaceae bacterium]
MLATVHSGVAQTPTLVPAKPTCPACRIALQESIALGEADGIGMLEADRNIVQRDSRGNFYVNDGVAPYYWVFDQRGQPLKRVGGRGSGPGEFQKITALAIGTNDSVYAFDFRLSRMSVLTSQGQFVRSVPTEYRPDLFEHAVLGSRVVLNANIRTPDRVGLPVHLLDRNGRILRSFGSVEGDYRPDVAYADRRVLAAAGPDAVWSGRSNRYLVERWDTAGRLLQSLEREPEWFREYWKDDISANSPPAPHTTALLQHGDTLWVVLTIADPNWKTVVKSASPDGRFFKISDENSYRDVMLEAIDVRKGQLLLSTKLPRIIWGFLGPGVVYGPKSRADGNPAVQVWDLRVVHP